MTANFVISKPFASIILMADPKLGAKTPPQDVEAEKSVLGSLMLNKDAINKVADFLITEDFYKKIHQKIYAAMLLLYKKGEPIDVLSTASILKEQGELEAVGGQNYLTELINCVPNALHVATYAKAIQKKRILRNLIESAFDISDLGYKQEEDPENLLDQAEKLIFDIAQKSIQKKFTSIKDALQDAFERLDKMSKYHGELRGVPTGFRDLDGKLSGLQKSDLIILAARPSIGKSSLALEVAKNVAIKSKKAVGLFSLEMGTDQIVDRLLASQANVDLWKLRSGKINDEEAQRLAAAADELNQAPLYINDMAGVNVLQIKAMARRLQAQHELGLIVIDYLQLMQPTNSNASVVQQVSEISRALKILARELNVPVLALSQLSRAVEQRIPPIPRLSDLRESGSLEQDADIVMFIYREDKYRQNTDKKNIATILISKHRNGPTGHVDIFFDSDKATFRNLVREQTQYQDNGGPAPAAPLPQEQAPSNGYQKYPKRQKDEGFQDLANDIINDIEV